MRRALAAAGVLGAVALSPVATQAAWAEPATAPSPVVLAQELDREPLSEDGDDDTAKYGLIGLTGMLGLFGYKKITERRAARPAPVRGTGPTTTKAPVTDTTTTRSTGTTGATGTSGTTGGQPIGDVDGDGSGSRRI